MSPSGRWSELFSISSASLLAFPSRSISGSGRQWSDSVNGFVLNFTAEPGEWLLVHRGTDGAIAPINVEVLGISRLHNGDRFCRHHPNATIILGPTLVMAALGEAITVSIDLCDFW